MFYKWYLTPKKMSQMYKKMSSNCWKCGTAKGSFFHLWWTCPRVNKLWVEVPKELTTILKTGFSKIPEIYLLELKLEEFKIVNRIILWYAAAAARLLLAKRWRSEQIFTVEEWIDKLTYLAELDKRARALKD